MSDHSKSVLGFSAVDQRRSSGRDWAHGMLSTVSLTALAVGLAPSAQAACTTTGVTTDCVGSTTSRVIVAGDGQTVTVQSGADVTGSTTSSGTGLVQIVGEDNTLNNNGTITLTSGAGGRAVRMNSTTGDLTLNNAGLIEALSNAGSGVFLTSTTGDIDVDNSGTIRVDGTGSGLPINVSSQDGNITFDNSGTITSANGFNTVTLASTAGSINAENSGSISGLGVGISAFGETVNVTNTQSGSINGIAQVVSVATTGSANIENAGTIATTSGVGVRVISSGYDVSTIDIVNTGDINSGGSATYIRLDDGTGASITNSGAITTSGRQGNGLFILSSTADADADLSAVNAASGTIVTSGESATGILIRNTRYLATDPANVTAENAGSITTSGNRAHGIETYSGTGDTDITNSGTIRATGLGAQGILARSYYSDTTIVNSGTIEADSTGVGAYSDIGNVSIENTGDVIARTGLIARSLYGNATIENSGTVDAQSFSGAFSGYGAASATNSGTLTSAEVYSAGLFANTGAGTASVVNTGDMIMTGVNAAALRAMSYGYTGSAAFISARNEGTITTTGDNAVGMQLLAYSNTSTSSSTTITVDQTTDGVIRTTGDAAYGILIQHYGAGDADIDSFGLIETTGDLASGIRADLANGDINLIHDGIIRATGAYALGIDTLSQNGSVSITATGDIVSDRNSISARSAASGDVLVRTAGALDSAAGFGVFAQALDGSVDVENLGHIQTNADNATAIRAQAVGAGTVLVSNSDRLSTAGFFASGIFGESGTGTVSLINTATGIIDVTRNGMRADTDGDADISNQGSITVTGQGAGLSANIGGDLTQTNSGTIVTTGDGSRGFSANVGGNALLTNDGAVTVVGDGGGTRGISSRMTLTGNSTIVNTSNGTVNVSGADALGIASIASSGTSSIDNRGSVSVSGSGVIGLSGVSSDGEIVVDNSGSVNADGAGAQALSLNAGTANISIVNSGDLTSSDQAIYSYGYGGALTLTSTGTITGDVSLNGTVDTVQISGALSGNIALGAFDDTLIFDRVDATALDQLISGGTGLDTLRLENGEGSSVSTAITDFETVIVGGAYAFDAASFLGVDTFTITDLGDVTIVATGASIDAATGVISDGQLSFEPGAILDITTGGFTARSGSITTFGIDGATPQIRADGAITFETDSAIEINVLDLDTLINGRTFDAAISGTSLTDFSADLTDNSMLFDFVKEVVGGDTLRITAEQILRIDEAAGLSDLSLLAPATALQDIVDGAGASSALLSTAFGQLPDDASIVAGVDQFVPGDSGGFAELGFETGRTISGLIHHADTRVDNPELAWNLWGAGFAGEIDGDADGISAGFDGSHQGFVIGLDRIFKVDGGTLRFGAAYFDASMDVAEETAQNNDGDMGYDGFAFYSQLALGAWHANAHIGSGDLDVSGRRANALIFEEAIFDTSGKQVFVAARAERGFEFGDWNFGVGAAVDHVDFEIDDYAETATFGGLNVIGQGSTSTQSELFVALDREYAVLEGGILTPDIRVALANRNSDIGSVTATLQAGGSSFALPLGERSGTGGLAEAGVSFDFTEHLAIRVGVRAMSIGDVSSQSGSLRLSAKF